MAQHGQRESQHSQQQHPQLTYPGSNHSSFQVWAATAVQGHHFWDTLGRRTLPHEACRKDLRRRPPTAVTAMLAGSEEAGAPAVTALLMMDCCTVQESPQHAAHIFG